MCRKQPGVSADTSSAGFGADDHAGDLKALNGLIKKTEKSGLSEQAGGGLGPGIVKDMPGFPLRNLFR